MRLEVVRMVADWLLSSTGGVNAYLASVPRDAADPAPDAIAAWADDQNAQVQPLAIFDETRHKWAANRLEDPPATPCLSVIAQGAWTVTGDPTPDGQIRRTTTPAQIAIRYQTTESDLARGIRNGSYTLRAVVRSLRELSRNANESARKRNGVLLELFEDPLFLYPIVESVGDTYVAGALVVNCKLRDYQPAY